MKITKKQLKSLILEVISSMDLIDDETFTQQFKKWATEYTGSPAGANSSSVLATFLVDQGYDKDENLVADMSDVLGFDLRDVSMEVKRQRREYDMGGALTDEEIYQRGFMEATMKITKRQLKKIIKEEKSKLLREVGDWEADLESLHQNPGVLRDKEQQLIGLMEEAIDLLDSIHDYHHMPQVEKVLESMRKVYERER